MNFHIRKAKKDDAKQILNLIIELAVFENEPNAVEINTEDIISSGFGKFKDFSCFVAETNEIIVGIALVYSRFSTWKGRILHLEDLIVTLSRLIQTLPISRATCILILIIPQIVLALKGSWRMK